MMLNQLKNAQKIKSSKRLGRGHGSGKGKTSSRGHKGQKSRTGFNIPNRFEGGQTSLIQKLAKTRGFKSLNKKAVIIKFDQLTNSFASGDVISPKTLFEKKLIESKKTNFKILGPQNDKVKYIFKSCKLSKSIRNK